MATSSLNSTIKRATPLAKSSESGDDSSYSTRRPASRRYRSLSRFSHCTTDPDAELTPLRKGKFVNTMRGSGFGEISLDDLAVEFFESFSGESGVSSGERGRSSSRKSGNSDVELTISQRRGRSVSRVGGSGGLRRLNADTESSKRRRSLSRKPSTRANSGSVRLNPGIYNSNRRRSVSRQPREIVNSENRGRIIGEDRENPNSRRRRSLSVVRRRIDNSESDVDQVQYSNNSRDVKSGKSQNTVSHNKPAVSEHGQSLRRSFTQKPIKYHDGYSSHSSAVTDDEGKDSSSSKNGTERIIRTVYAQKTTPKKRESLGNSDYGSQRKSHDNHHPISTVKKGYATKLQESEEQHGKELSMNLKELLTENSSEAKEKLSRMRKRSKDRSRSSSRRMSMCLTDEAEQFIDEFISKIEDTDLSSLEDERSESSSSFGLIKTQSSQSATTGLKKSIPVEMDGVMLPWLQWESQDEYSVSLAYLNKSPHTPNTELFAWESDPTQGASSGHETSIGTIGSSRGSWSPNESATKLLNPIRRLKIDVTEYLKRPNDSDILHETWKIRHRISSGGIVLCSRSFI